VKFVVSHDGDASVGVPAERATVVVDVESYAIEVRGDYIRQVRDALMRAFSELWNTTVRIAVESEARRDQVPTQLHSCIPDERGIR
jgi:hypothetical protein